MILFCFAEISRPRKRLMELLIQAALEPKEEMVAAWSNAEKSFEPIFYRNPAAFLPNTSGELDGMRLTMTELQGDMSETQTVKSTSAYEDIKCGLALRSIGYKGLPADPDIPFDNKSGVIKNRDGRVEGLAGIFLIFQCTKLILDHIILVANLLLCLHDHKAKFYI
jgi:adrenodoxin-NADP+ reductase